MIILMGKMNSNFVTKLLLMLILSPLGVRKSFIEKERLQKEDGETCSYEQTVRNDKPFAEEWTPVDTLRMRFCTYVFIRIRATDACRRLLFCFRHSKAGYAVLLRRCGRCVWDVRVFYTCFYRQQRLCQTLR